MNGSARCKHAVLLVLLFEGSEVPRRGGTEVSDARWLAGSRADGEDV